MGSDGSLFFLDLNIGWIVGQNGIKKTTNGGLTWFDQYSSEYASLGSIYFTDANHGWAVGNWFTGIWGAAGRRGMILYTNNGGTTWNEQTTINHNLGGVYFPNDHTGWAVGGGGTILHTTNGGVSFVEEEEIDEVPTEFLLSQNYPNPFNPSTKIKYSAPQASNVVIKVFDILGNEIATLMDEEKSVGNYELTWNAENLPSGVYFYQIKAGTFIQTKKMLLLK